jgi:hypothetical protein
VPLLESSEFVISMCLGGVAMKVQLRQKRDMLLQLYDLKTCNIRISLHELGMFKFGDTNARAKSTVERQIWVVSHLDADWWMDPIPG